MHSTVICVGNGQAKADKLAQAIAKQYNLDYCGVLDATTVISAGCYHTSIYDIKLQELLDKIDKTIKIIVLDQGTLEYTDANEYYKTLDLAQSLVNTVDVEFVNPTMLNPFKQILEENKSFCLMPFISVFKSGNNIQSCCLMNSTVTSNLQDFSQDPDLTFIRGQMLAGNALDKYCGSCYAVEQKGATSERQSYTIEWSYKQNLKSYEDVTNNTKILNYEINVGNKCNALCRSCNPQSSNLVDKEYHSIGLSNIKIGLRESTDFDIVDITQVQRIYLNGGEPTVSQPFLDFLQRCIDQKATDVEIVVNTNALSISDRFVDLVKQFKNFKFEISIDGYDDLNYYIRWPITWNKFSKNVERLNEVTRGKISFNTVVSIYNVSSLSKIFEYLEMHYPTSVYHIRFPDDPEQILPWNFPNKELAIEDLRKIKNLVHYQQDAIFKNKIDGLINTITVCEVDQTVIDKFFEFNDRLDNSRKLRLKDYVPELEKYRPN